MTNPPTDEIVNVARHAAMTYRPTPEPLEGPQVSISFGQMRAALEAALSHQGEVVKVSELRNLAHWWGKNLVRMVGRVNPHEIAGLKRCHEELTALISKAEKA